MTSRLPAAARSRAAATLPPEGLPGLDPAFSRLVTAAGRGWHLLDNGPVLEAAGIEPSGTVLCVHGNPTWSYLWRSLVAQSTDQARSGGTAWRVIAVDQLEMGFSERTGVARGLPTRVADLGELTDELALSGPVVTFGHDWGGIISLGWALDHPDLVAGIMLLNTAVHQPESSKIPAPLRLTLQHGVLGRATVTTPAFLETTLALAHPPLSRAVKDAYRAPYRGAASRGGIGTFVADIPVADTHPSNAERHRIAEALRDVDVPALLLWGPRDPIFSDRYLDDLIQRLPHADVHRYEGAGHLVAEDVDFAHDALTWLGDRVSKADDQDPEAGSAPGTTPRPLWGFLDERRDSDATALVEMARTERDAPRVVSWRTLSRRVDRLAAGLLAIGVTKGDRVSLLVQPGVELTTVLYACLRIGAIVVVADAGLGIRGLTRAVRGAWPQHVIGALPGLTAARALGWPGQRISTTVLPPVAARALGVGHSLPELSSLGAGSTAGLPEGAAPDDLAAILFTSGSTGPAKGVAYTHAQLTALCSTLGATYGVGADTGLVAGFAPFALLGPALGARSVTPAMDVTAPATLSARAVAAAADEAAATVLFLSPAALANVVATAGDLDADDHRALAGVTTVLSAGAPVSPALLSQAAALVPNAIPHTPYGMTEGLLLTDVTLDEILSASTGPEGGVCVGTPVAGVELRISALDDDGHPTSPPRLDPDVTGEIVVSAAHIRDHYDRLWATDRSSRRDLLSGRRWHRTGDVGHLDAQGRLWVEGRIQHLISTSAGVLTPVGPEQRVERLAEVARAAVVGVGPAGRQQVVVIVETNPGVERVGLAPSELAAEVRGAANVAVAAIFVVPRLPTDVRHNSKIDRSRLAVWADEILAGGPMDEPR